MIRRGDGELTLAYRLFCRHGILPSRTASMGEAEKALMAAMLELEGEA